MKISRHLVYRIRKLTWMLNSGWHKKWAKSELTKITEQIKAEQQAQEAKEEKTYIVGTVVKTTTETINTDISKTVINTTKEINTDEDGLVTSKVVKIIKEEKWLDGLTSKFTRTENDLICIEYDSEDPVKRTITSIDSEYSIDGHSGNEVTVILNFESNEKRIISKTTVPDEANENGHTDSISESTSILEVNAYKKKIPLVPIVEEIDEDMSEQLSVDPDLLNQLASIDDYLDEDTSSSASDEVLLSKINLISDSTNKTALTSKISKIAATVNKSGSTITFQGLQVLDNVLQMVTAEDDDNIDVNDYKMYWFTRMNVQLINGHIIIKT